ncbi:Putative dihydropyrimidine dehydrogenase [NADP+], similar to dihydroorotate dehydrogenase [hydrothermal vent metagenome]|uniref:Dihydropyrimidine dehydrogenase [NADP+], similar to dihydroorotate dehydrogenase n=1 Tax=hydrothermal vent metagenome TaxID=652676 RepID=A0A3B1C6J6_9ZZZZ
MADLSTKYLGLELKNPIIASSSTLTDNVESIKNLAENGASAIVLRSIFEEEITLENESFIEEAVKDGYEEGLFDYYDKKIKQDNVNKYLELISDAKAAVDVPIIASINCMSNHEWTYFAKKIEDAGADALELNMFFLPSWFDRSCDENEVLYFDVVHKVLSEVTIPVTLKISHYFSNLSNMISELSQSGVKGLVLFNKFFSPDFDIEEEKVTPTYVYSNPQDIALPLRWIAIMSEKVECDLVASTGIHDGEGVVKQLLAGAKAVQIASTLYKNGSEQIGKMLTTLEDWMNKKGYSSLDDFRGKMSYGKVSNPALYERVQFMKHFGSKK